MILDLNSEGRMVLREINGEVIEYIENEREKHALWCLSKTNYDGTFYFTSQYCVEDTEQAISLIDALKEKYGLSCTKSADEIVKSWRESLRYFKWEMNQTEREKALRERLDDIKRILRDGCEACLCFAHDGDNGRCKADGGELFETPLCFAYGRCDRDGVLHLGQKFYPHSGCKYLTGEVL